MTESAVRAAFRDQARSCRELGSPLTAAICDLLAQELQAGQGRVADRVLNWPGDASSRGQSVPLRLCGALHALVLTGAAPELAAAYRAGCPDRRAILNALTRHEASILNWLDSPPQTNEVARSAVILATARFLTALYPLPIRALELGASAGLNLNFARYHLGPRSGADEGGVVLRPDWRGPLPRAPIEVPEAVGVDLRPLEALRDPVRLLAYCWPDQAERLARLRAALKVAASHPPRVERGDAGNWLATRLARPRDGLTLVFHTIAWQYFPPPTRRACEAALRDAGAVATGHAPLAHFGMEADGAGPGAGLRLRLWDGKCRAWDLGRADFHGRWVDWNPREISPAPLGESGIRR